MNEISRALRPGGALHALAATDSFLVYELRPKADSPGKMDKVPVAPYTWGTAAELLSAEAAIALCSDWQSEHGHGVGYVFQPGCGFFFLDMDGYWVDGAWKPLVNEMFKRLRGAAFEVSSSRKGCHFFGRHTGLPPHGNKNIPLNLEFYSEKRFVALTGLQAVGDASLDCTDAVLDIIAEYFPARVSTAPAHNGEGPREDYDGPVDDADLIAMACRSGKAKSAFGGAATFKDLWECNTEKLANNWPANSDGGDFDRSSADMALASHLAFWTGCDAERMDRLMRASGLCRDKYERADYMVNTIAKAIAGCTEVFGSRRAERIEAAQWTDAPMTQFPERKEPVEVAVTMLAAGGYFHASAAAQNIDKMAWVAAHVYPGECSKQLEMITATGVEDTPALRDAVTQANAAIVPTIPVEVGKVGELTKLPIITEGDGEVRYGAAEQADIFKDCVIVSGQNAAMLPDGRLLTPDQFNLAMPAGTYTVTPKKVVDKPWAAFVSSQILEWPRAEDVQFRPDLKPGQLFIEEGRRLVNSYAPHPMVAVQGDVSLFLRHVRLLVPDARDQEILLSWMAAVAQYPGRKFRWAPVLQGCEGNGKGIITSALQQVVGSRYTHYAQASDVANKFNDWIVGNLLVIVNEADLRNNQEAVDAIKPMISDDFVAVQGKGKSQATSRNFANFILTTNHPGAMGKAVKGRRYSVFMTAQQTENDCKAMGMDGAYFSRLVGWLQRGNGYAMVADFLRRYPISEEFNPAGGCVNAPRTSSYGSTVDAAKDSLEQAIEEAIEEGRRGFTPVFVCGKALADLMLEVRRNNPYPKNKRRELMDNLGYDWHPSAPEKSGGRANRDIKGLITMGKEVPRPVIYVRKGHPINELKDFSEVVNRFEKIYSNFGMTG